MAENATTAAPAPAAPVDAQAIQAKAIADIQARNKDFIDTGKAYAKWGGEALAMQAVAEGWNREQLTSALMKAMAAGPAHPTYGQGARTEDNGDDANSRGFQSLGEFAYQVRSAALRPGRIDQRLVRAAATTFAGEDAGADGGFSVPPQFANEIVSLAMQEQSLLAMANDVPVQGNSMRFPKDETTPWGSDGVIATWDGEGDVIAQRKPVIGRSDLFLHRLTVLVPASDELLEDSMAMSAHLQRKMSEAVLWKTNDAIVNGTGAGQPLGIMTAASTVSQDKETSQTAKTITFPNVTKMYGRCIKGAGANLAWLVHPDAINQIYLLTNGTQSIWTPPVAGAKEAPNGYLLGRPIVETDACQTLGAVGDIILANMAGYRAITKAGGAQFAQSMHLYFDQNMQAFRLVFRMDGQPQLAKAVSPKNGSSTRSHFVTLAVRS